MGHGGKSGKADICVKNKDSSPYLCIIECKTADSEYKKELSNMKADGGQLFSYWQQSKATKWLVLYASDFDEENQKLTSTVATVNCSDDANFIELAKDDSSLKLYKDATTVEDLFEVWKETYEQKFYGDIIFDDETVAYDIGVLPLKKKRLVDFSRDDKIVNQFEEILRHNNVSDKENAFNRLIALFIAKLYDEKTKTLDSEVEFQYKTGTDTYQKMQDRLQKLHHFGMKEFMKEDVFYVADDYVKTVMRGAIGENREKLEAELNETITKLKFYTNNDFAFKDVHNKALFYQNGKILVEMVELFQKYRIIDSNELQLLGDMFEQLLNKGFKQNEGQFFTPIPITCFIWKCLPLESIVVNEKKEICYPKVIDYACGAGHFLTEGFREINETVLKLGLKAEKGWERDCIFGIEKDYRLARVSKISMFMHGADNGNIVFGDGLDNHNEKIVIENGQFDILVANPPYSVSAFKNHLELKNNGLNLLQYISKDGKEIETLFVERISQLLKPNGIAAVILPSSILSNSSTSYIKAREEILKNFAVHAIVQFGSKTFGATGTNTVVLYLQKNSEPPVKSEITKDNVTAIFENEELNVTSDREVLKSYCEKISVPKEEYIDFLKDSREASAEKDWKKYKDSAYFGLYAKEFEASTDFKKLKAEKQSKAFFDYVLEIEKEKLYFFALVYKQQTLVVTAPSDNAEQENFLGYSWSNRKGDEGIKIKSSTPQNSCGLLYNVYDEENSIARYVKDSFLGIYRSGKYISANALKDMIDFSRTTFDKAIKPNVQAENGKMKIESKFPLMKLGTIAPFVTERISSSELNKTDYITTDNLLQNRLGIKDYEGEMNFDSAIRYCKNDILISNIRPYLKKIWFADTNGGCSPDVLVFRIADEKKI
ncbi:MAG: restriction endonuclease subunit M, partial [Treponema sp.]|nr:restriction endonuclease subunit M [Treponema sp.]